MSLGSFRIAIAAVVVALAACASGARAPGATADAHSAQAALRSFEEPQALALIDELLVESSLEPHPGFQVDLKERRDFHVDLRVGEAPVGIEWVSEQDRARYGSLLPPPDPEGQLRVLAGGERNGQAALILVLDHESYRFAQKSTPGAGAT